MRKYWRKHWMFLAVVALFGAGNVLFSTSAVAEFFGCDDQHPARHSSTTRAPAYARGAPVTHEFAAQSRPQITIYPRETGPGRNATRQCRSWLAKEYRISGPVIVPKMRCWWQ